jgi:hypothetical protein
MISMNPGQFVVSLEDVWKILKEVKLDGSRQSYPLFPKHPRSNFKGLSYLQIYQACLELGYFHFQLLDNSLLEFRADCFQPLVMSYVFYECPYQIVSFEEFVSKIINDQSDLDDLGTIYEIYEEQYLSTISRDIKKFVCPIRYDYNESLYSPGIHPVSHMHIGLNNEIRIGLRRVLTPLSFTLFIIRQCYPNKWKNIHSSQHIEGWCRQIRESLEMVSENFWQMHDEREHILF